MQTILGSLQRATNILEQRVDERLVELGLNAKDLQVMRLITEMDRTTTAEIREATGLRPSTLSSQLTRLERIGYLRRRRGGRDRRSRIVEPTLPGEQATVIGASILFDLEAALGGIRTREADLARLTDITFAITNLPPVRLDPEDGLPELTA